MKYKNIKSMLHNFGHSFVSNMNCVDGEFGKDLLAAALKELPQYRLEVCFPSQRIEPPADYSPKLRKSVAVWAELLPQLMAKHDVTLDALPEFALVIFGDVHGMHCRVQATDARGKAYDILVNEA